MSRPNTLAGCTAKTPNLKKYISQVYTLHTHSSFSVIYMDLFHLIGRLFYLFQANEFVQCNSVRKDVTIRLCFMCPMTEFHKETSEA